MPTLPFLQLDVFTDRRFEGNQLAVFTDAGGLDAALMQTIAREMNFSESTFLMPPERGDTDVRMRIFTPGVELPMAGHPTIGSTFALAHLGVIPPARDHYVFGLGVGPTRVELRHDNGALSFAWMDQLRPEFREPATPLASVLDAVGLDAATFQAAKLPFEEISTGVPYLMLPLPTREAVDRAEANMAALRRLKSAFPVDHVGVFLFTMEQGTPAASVYSRMFAPELGIAEDPATGSASGPLGCYLVKHGLVASDRARDLVSLQGVKMGRPSRIHIAITADAPDRITRVQVGGTAVVVAEGTLRF